MLQNQLKDNGNISHLNGHFSLKKVKSIEKVKEEQKDGCN